MPKTKTIFGTTYLVNEEYVRATNLSEKLLQQVGEIRNQIDELERLTDVSTCQNPELIKQRKTLIEYMKNESKELEMSFDAYFSQTGE